MFTGGTTYHTGLDIFPGTDEYVPLSSKKLQTLRTDYSDLQVMILDEMSMLGAGRLYDIHHRLQDIFISKDLFGGIGSLLVGDILQLPPVLSQEVYKCPKTLQNAALFNSSENLWNNCQVVVLKYNYRQGVGEWTDTLNRARMGELTEKDIELLETRRLKNFPHKDFSRATHLYRTNREVREHNDKVLNSLDTLQIFQKAELDCPKGFKPWVDEDKGTFYVTV